MTHFDDTIKATKRKPEIASLLQQPSSFAYFGELPIGVTWTLGPVILSRDSSILTQSNYDAILKMLAGRHDLANRWEIVHCSHWAGGWVDHLAYRVIMGNGQPDSKMIGFIEVLKETLESYPVLDEDDFSQREWTDAVAWCTEATRVFAREYEEEITLPDDVGERVCAWLTSNDKDYSTDEDHNYPNEARVKAALIGLGYLKENS